MKRFALERFGCGTTFMLVALALVEFPIPIKMLKLFISRLALTHGIVDLAVFGLLIYWASLAEKWIKEREGRYWKQHDPFSHLTNHE